MPRIHITTGAPGKPWPHPSAGFEWMAVSWGGPGEPLVRQCSYCDAEIDSDDVPMVMWTSTGWRARFCVECQSQWWGLL